MSEVINRELTRISVRGVGFKPFIYQLTVKHGLNARVSNTSEDVKIEVERESGFIERYLVEIPIQLPPKSVIENISSTHHPVAGYIGFVIQDSITEAGKYQLNLPDSAAEFYP